MVTADDYRQAIEAVRANYPEDVFLPDSDSPDAAGARFARKLCDEIVRRAEERPVPRPAVGAESTKETR